MAAGSNFSPPIPSAVPVESGKWILNFPDGTREELGPDDWHFLERAWANISALCPSPESRPQGLIPVVYLALRDLILDVIGLRGEQADEVFYRRFGAALNDCIRSQPWFDEIAQALCRLSADTQNPLRPELPLPVSLRRKTRITHWKKRGHALTARHFQEFTNIRLTTLNTTVFFERLTTIAERLDREDLEILVHTGLALSGDAEIRLSIERRLRTALASRFCESIRPDPWACIWRNGN